MELKQLTEHVYYIPNFTNIGAIRNGKKLILIDSGLDSDTAKKILKTINDKNFHIEAIINTHSHADHCGGNAYLKEKVKLKIYAPELEYVMIENPLLESIFLFSGAMPIESLKNKFLMAPPSKVDYVIKSNENKLIFDDVEIKIVKLPGHSPNHIGIAIDNILFCGDAIFSPKVLRKHKIPFYIDIEVQKQTLNYLKNSSYNLYIPSHGEPIKDINSITDKTLKLIDSIEETIIEFTKEAKTTEHIIKKICNSFKVEIKNYQQYFLTKTIIMAYLGSLNNNQRLNVQIKDNQLFWKRI
ncbi:MBL fold metallo-hydrolase [Thermodesulfatator indicus]